MRLYGRLVFSDWIDCASDCGLTLVTGVTKLSKAVLLESKEPAKLQSRWWADLLGMGGGVALVEPWELSEVPGRRSVDPDIDELLLTVDLGGGVGGRTGISLSSSSNSSISS
jgi:hypothetical protein